MQFYIKLLLIRYFNYFNFNSNHNKSVKIKVCYARDKGPIVVTLIMYNNYKI